MIYLKLVVGLGNPGKEYENTKHNVGFSFIDFYLDSLGEKVSWIKKDNGVYFQTIINQEKVLFLKPQTYMNLSGDCVCKFVNYYHISMDDIMVVSDDLDLNIGNFKLKTAGSCGGHNGLRDIENKLHSNQFKRLKIGISKDHEIDTKDYVLSGFSKKDRENLDHLFHSLIDVMNDYFVLSFEKLMSKYNRKNK